MAFSLSQERERARETAIKTGIYLSILTERERERFWELALIIVKAEESYHQLCNLEEPTKPVV